MASARIRPARPYSLEMTVGAFRRFPHESVDRVGDFGYRRAFKCDDRLVLLQANQASDEEPLAAPVSITPLTHASESTTDAARQKLLRILAVDEEIEPVYQAMKSDPRLRFLAQRLCGLRRTIDPTPFEGLVSSILAQLISIRGAAVVRTRFVRAFGRCVTYEEQEYWAFPEPEHVQDATIDQLCGLGMTQTKARAIQNVAMLSARGELDLTDFQRLPDSEVIRELVTLPGIGPWTAEWFLINVLGRMSVAPSGDLGIRRSAGNWLLDGAMPSPVELTELYEPFGELRAYVAYYVLSAERLNLTPPHSE